MNAVMLPARTVFIADTYVNADPDGRAADRDHAARRRRDPPLRHHAQGGAAVAFDRSAPATIRRRKKMRDALALIQRGEPGSRDRRRDARRRGAVRRPCARRHFPNSRLKGEANLLIMPTLDAANISFNLLKVGLGRRRDAGPDSARRGQARAHPDAIGNCAADREHDRADRRRLLDPAGSRRS